MPILSLLLQAVYLVIYFFLLFLMTRLVMSFVLQFARRWHPQRGAAAAMEVVWSVTDPPLKALRRVIPPLRIGTVSLDLAFMVLLVIVYVLLYIVLPRLIFV